MPKSIDVQRVIVLPSLRLDPPSTRCVAEGRVALRPLARRTKATMSSCSASAPRTSGAASAASAASGVLGSTTVPPFPPPLAFFAAMVHRMARAQRRLVSWTRQRARRRAAMPSWPMARRISANFHNKFSLSCGHERGQQPVQAQEVAHAWRRRRRATSMPRPHARAHSGGCCGRLKPRAFQSKRQPMMAGRSTASLQHWKLSAVL